jgi:hypothetical protein
MLQKQISLPAKSRLSDMDISLYSVLLNLEPGLWKGTRISHSTKQVSYLYLTKNTMTQRTSLFWKVQSVHNDTYDNNIFIGYNFFFWSFAVWVKFYNGCYVTKTQVFTILLLQIKQTGNVRLMQEWGAFVQPLLPCRRNKNYTTWVYVCSLTYPACKAHAPYCHMCPAPFCNVLPHCLIHGSVWKRLLNTKCVFWFSLQLLSQTFLVLRINGRDMIKNVYRSSSKVPFVFITL